MDLSIRYTDELPKNVPAAINWRTGEMLLSKTEFIKLPDAVREFVLLHEKGHWELKTKDEFEANNYALENFLARGEITEFGHKLMVLIDEVPKISEPPAKKPAKNEKSYIDPITISAITAAGTSLVNSIFGGTTQNKLSKEQADAAITVEKEKTKQQELQQENYKLIAYVFLVLAVVLLVISMFKFMK